ncbi:hypothetical protein ABPG74_020171 [Tetrahymena malaccensis]
MDIFLLIMTIIIGVLLIFCNLYILGVYCHPEDKGFGANAYCKLIVIVGFTLSWGQVLMVPLDVSNSRGYGGGFDMMTVWYVIYIIVLVFISFIIPTAQFYYESDDEKSMCERLTQTIAMEFVMILLMGVFQCIFYLFCSTAAVPITVLYYGTSVANNGMVNFDYVIPQNYFVNVSQSTKQTTLSFNVSLYISIMAFLSFIGYFFLVLFGGMGLSALPIDLLRSYRSRPTFKSSKQAFAKKNQLKEMTQKLIDLSEKMQEDLLEIKYQKGFWARRKMNNKTSAEFQIFSEAVLQLDDEHQLFKMELDIATTNPLIYYAKLLLGFFGIIISLVWWVHILLAVIVKKNGFPIYPLLDKMFLKLESIGVTFLAVAFFTMFTLYLLWCTMKGNFKIGIAIPFLFTIHPMRPNETWMNSFLFNLNIILITTVALVQFVSKCFSQYMRYTELDQIYGRQVEYLEFYKYFYTNNVFEIALLAWSGLSAFYFIYKSQEKPKLLLEIEQQKTKMEKQYKGKNEIELQELLIKKGVNKRDIPGQDDDDKDKKNAKGKDKKAKEEKDLEKGKSKEKDKDKDKDKGKSKGKEKAETEKSVYEFYDNDVEKNKSKKGDSKKKK